MSLPAVGVEYVTSRSVTQLQINAYAEASGDRNPLHVDPVFAVSTPLGGTVAHGMLVLGWVSALLTEAFGHAWIRHGTLRVRFRTPARPGDTLALRAQVTSVDSQDEVTKLGLTVTATNQGGDEVLSGQATVAIPRR